MLWAVVVFVIIGGVWLAGLTYLMWRAHRLSSRKPKEKEPPEEPKPQEEVESS